MKLQYSMLLVVVYMCAAFGPAALLVWGSLVVLDHLGVGWAISCAFVGLCAWTVWFENLDDLMKRWFP